MTPRKHSLIAILLALTALGLAAFMLIKDHDKSRPAGSPTDVPGSAPDISLSGIQQTFVENGLIKWRLKAASARLSRAGNRIQINDIDMTLYTADGRNCHVTADRGLVSLDTRNANIYGNVVIHHPDYKIQTETLRYRAERHIIETDEPVRMESRMVLLTGDRLRYDLDAMRAELNGNVDGIINENLTR